MERNEISIHEVRIFLFLKKNLEKWITNKQISEGTKVSERTVRAHTLKLVKMGILNQAEVFPAHRFRYSDKADKRNRGYFERLTSACEVFGEDC